MKKRVGTRRGVRALVLVASIVGVITAGIASQASAIPPPPNPPVLIGTGEAQNSTNKSVTADIDLHADAGSVIVVSVATGTFQGTVGCTDNTNGTSPSTNVYTVVADKNTGNGRLFVCVSKLTKGYNEVADPTVTGTYPQFSGGSVIRVVAFTNATSVVGIQSSTGAGSNPAVNSGTICVTGRHFLFGVVANGNVSTFTADSPWVPLDSPPPADRNSVGSGAGKRTLTTAYQLVDPYLCTDYSLTGSLSGSGFWQAAIVGLAV
jgi:hypothetical protein